MRYFALLSAQGTACSDTTLTEDEYNNPTYRRVVDERARHTTGPDAPIPGTWTDVTDNDAIRAAMEENVSGLAVSDDD